MYGTTKQYDFRVAETILGGRGEKMGEANAIYLTCTMIFILQSNGVDIPIISNFWK